MMNIYSFPTFNLTKLLLTAEEIGLPYHLHLMKPGDHKSPEHLARHPLGKVPAVEYQGQYFFESNSICRLMAELNGNKLYGNTPEQRAHINEWVDMIAHHIGRWLTVYFFEEVIKPGLLQQTPDAKALKEAEGFLAQQLPSLDKTLSQQTFITGNDITIADTIAFSLMTIQDVSSINLKSYTHIQRWYQQMKARPAYARALQHVGGNMYAGFGK